MLVAQLDEKGCMMNVVSGLEDQAFPWYRQGEGRPCGRKTHSVVRLSYQGGDETGKVARFGTDQVEKAHVDAKETGRSTGRPYGDAQGAKEGAGRGSAPVLGAGGYHRLIELEDKRS